MIRVLGSEVRIIRCSSSPPIVGIEGTVALETMRTLTIVAPNSRKLVIPKKGTVLMLTRTDEIVIADEMEGRLEERLARGAGL